MKKLIFSVICATMALGASAEVLTPAEALQRAGGVQRIGSLGATTATASPVLTVKAADEQPAIYVFDTKSDAGFAIVSADDLAMPLLGYSDSETFDATAIPTNMQAWLDFYAAEIAAARAAGTKSHNSAYRISRPARKAIAPICKTRWNQGSPYNNLCPKSGLTPTYTGCVATAVAQVLKTYEYPVKCSGGTFTYTAGKLKKDITLNFDNITLNWDLMLDDYSVGVPSSAQKSAVANLMYAVGVAGQMNYGTQESGTYGLYMGSGLVRNFGFSNKMSYLMRDWFDLNTWEDKIYNVLKGGHAVYYDGVTSTTPAAGHAFVIDGYQGDGYFHLNWGWGGTSDGYFLLTALDPESQGIGGSTGGYNFSQGAMFDLEPVTEDDEAPLIFYMVNDFTVTPNIIAKGSSVKFLGNPCNYSLCEFPGVRFCAKFTAQDGTVFYGDGGKLSQNMPQFLSVNDYNCIVPRTLTNGTYIVTPAVKSDGGKYYDVYTRQGGHGELIATVSGSKVTFSTPQYSNIEAEDINVPSTLYINSAADITATLYNPTDQYYVGGVKGALVTSNNDTDVTTKYQSDAIAVDVAGSTESDMKLRFTLPSTITAGEYKFCIKDYNDNIISELIPVSVKANPGSPTLKWSTLRITDRATDGLKFTFNATAEKGYFSNPVIVYVWRNSEVVTHFTSESVYLEPGQSATVNISGMIEGGTIGGTYQANAYYKLNGELKQCSDMISFLLGKAGIEDIATDDDAPAEYFDLQGRRIDKPEKGSICLKRQGGVTTKEIIK